MQQAYLICISIYMRMCVIVYTNACMHTCKFAVKYLFLIFPFPSLFFLITIFIACSFYASFFLLVRMKAGHWSFNIFFSFSLPLFPIPYFFSYDQWKSFIFFFHYLFSLFEHIISSIFCFAFYSQFSSLYFPLIFLDYIFYFFSSVILYANLLCEFIWFIFNLYFYSF